jgi:hypothetical protein
LFSCVLNFPTHFRKCFPSRICDQAEGRAEKSFEEDFPIFERKTFDEIRKMCFFPFKLRWPKSSLRYVLTELF